MATIQSIAITRDNALASIERSLRSLVSKLGIDPVEIPRYNRDAAYLQAQQLAALATLCERVVDALGGEELEAFTIDELQALAHSRGVDIAGLRRKDDLIAALQAAGRNPSPKIDYSTYTLNELLALADQRNFPVADLTNKSALVNALTIAIEQSTTPDDRNLAKLSRDELYALAEERGVPLTSAVSKTDLIAALERADRTQPATDDDTVTEPTEDAGDQINPTDEPSDSENAPEGEPSASEAVTPENTPALAEKVLNEGKRRSTKVQD
jgi:hypothetical protein